MFRTSTESNTVNNSLSMVAVEVVEDAVEFCWCWSCWSLFWFWLMLLMVVLVDDYFVFLSTKYSKLEVNLACSPTRWTPEETKERPPLAFRFHQRVFNFTSLLPRQEAFFLKEEKGYEQWVNAFELISSFHISWHRKESLLHEENVSNEKKNRALILIRIIFENNQNLHNPRYFHESFWKFGMFGNRFEWNLNTLYFCRTLSTLMNSEATCVD